MLRIFFLIVFVARLNALGPNDGKMHSLELTFNAPKYGSLMCYIERIQAKSTASYPTGKPGDSNYLKVTRSEDETFRFKNRIPEDLKSRFSLLVENSATDTHSDERTKAECSEELSLITAIDLHYRYSERGSTRYDSEVFPDEYLISGVMYLFGKVSLQKPKQLVWQNPCLVTRGFTENEMQVILELKNLCLSLFEEK